MRMLENEDSVVTSLNELRKLKHERITRQTHSRAVVGAGRAAALAIDPASDQMTPPPATVSALAQHAPFAQAPSAPADTGFGGFAMQAPAFDPGRMAPPPPIIQTKTSYTAAVVMTVLLLGAGGAGYMKLQTDSQAERKTMDAKIRQAEDARMQAAEIAAKAEVQARNNLRQCEDKLKTALAMAPAAPAVAAPSEPVVEKKPEKAPARVASSRASARRSSAARSSRRAAAAEPAAPKDVPTIARKKKLNDDPLAGLGKL
jgi:hypothetical protein